MVPLTAVTDDQPPAPMPLSINHSGQIPAITISFDLAPGKALSDAVSGHAQGQRADRHARQRSRAVSQGTAAAFQSSTKNMGLLLLIAMMVVYIILGILYESFIHPLTILSGLPSAAVGALLTLYLVGMPLTLYAFVGMIMLIGIVKKNAIMMIDFALQPAARRRGDAAGAGDLRSRHRPLPPHHDDHHGGVDGHPAHRAWASAPGAESRRPLGLCVAGGLLLSQLLTLYITPVIYTYLDNLQKRFGTFRQIADEEPAPRGAAE